MTEIEDDVIADDIIDCDASAAPLAAPVVFGKVVLHVRNASVCYSKNLRAIVVIVCVGFRVAMKKPSIWAKMHPIDREALRDAFSAINRVQRPSMVGTRKRVEGNPARSSERCSQHGHRLLDYRHPRTIYSSLDNLAVLARNGKREPMMQLSRLTRAGLEGKINEHHCGVALTKRSR